MTAVGLPILLQNTVSEPLPWEIRAESLDGPGAPPVLEEAATAVAAAMRSLGLNKQGLVAPALDGTWGTGVLGGFEGAFHQSVTREDAEDEYLTADESPKVSGGEVSLNGALGGLGDQEDDARFWQSEAGRGEEDDGEYESDVEDLDLFLPRIMEQTGFTPTLTEAGGFLGFGLGAYTAMQAAAPAGDQLALVPYAPEESPPGEFAESSAVHREGQSPEGGASRKRNVYLCKRCGQIKKGHTCNPSAAPPRVQRSQPPVEPAPPPKSLETPKPPKHNLALQPYSFSAFPSPAPPLLDDLQSFFSSPKDEAPAGGVVLSASERGGLVQNIGYKPSKAASATAISAAQSMGPFGGRSPRVIIPKYKDPPTNARLLLATGLLEGQHVSYIMQSGKVCRAPSDAADYLSF
jgi:hypothetical protein